MNAEALLQALQRSSIAMSVFDAEGRYVLINDAAEALMGVPRATLLGRSYLDAPNVREDDPFDRAFRALVVDGQTRQLRIAGAHRHFDVDMSRAGGIVVVLWRDVTAIVDVHQATELERDRWHVLFEQAPAQISVTMGPEHRCVFVNARARAAVGGRTDLVGKTPKEAFPELIDSPLHATLDEVYRTGTPWVGTEIPVPFARADGVQEERYFTLVYQPVRDDQSAVVGIMSFAFEVTETVRARRRLETMFDGNLVGNLTWNLDGTITNANDAFLRMVGYTREDLERGTLSWRALTPPDFAESDRQAVKTLVETRRHAPYEKEYLKKDGTRVPILVSTAMFPDSDAEGISYIVDLTEVKEAETRIRALLHEAQEASRAKDQFLAMLGHELRNPLAPISTAVELMKMRGIEATELATLERQVSHMSRLVDDLLDIARIARGEITLDRRLVDLRRIVERAVEIVEPLVEKHRHTLNVSVPNSLIGVRGDEARLTQALSNLLVNAARYTPEGGRIELRVQPDPTRGTVRISVRDNGVGIEPEPLKHIFEPFYRASITHTRGGVGGLGLGLAIVRNIASLHDGKVSAVSAGADLGSEFTLTLPLLPAEQLDELRPRRRSAADPHRRRVLVVDDNTDAADMLAMLIAHHGHDVKVANDGPEAIRIADTFEPEVVLLDLSLPVMDGFAIARELRARHGTDIKLVALTGFGQASDRGATRAAGFDGHLVKPVSIELVLRELAAPPAA